MNGLSVSNASGAVIISETYKNYHLVSSGAVSNSTALPTVAAGELLCVRPSSAGALIYASGTSGSFIKVNTGSVEWVKFQFEIPATAQNYGLRVFTPTGTIAFDSGAKAMLPVSITRMSQGSYGSSLSITQPFTPGANRKRYALASSFRLTGIAETGAQYQNWRGTGIVWSSDNSMTLQEGDLMGEIGPGDPNFPIWAPIMNFAFIDV